MGIIDELRAYKVETEAASWHPSICGKAVDYIAELLARAEAAEARLEMAHAELEAVRKAQMENQARAEKAEKCIAEIEDALRFGRDSAAMLRIYEWSGQKEE